MEIRNKFYTQRFFATRLPVSDLFRAVTYTQYEGSGKIPFWYKKIVGNTGTIDLTQDMDAIFSAMKSNTRNEIRRAEREGCVMTYDYDYESFIPFYNAFSASKGLDENIDIGRLDKYDRTLITSVMKDGVVLTMHATVVNKAESVAMLLYSGSQRLTEGSDRKLIGWANRYLHYKEFELFKGWGIERYEWDGICLDPEQKEKYNIGLFKTAFGGQVKECINLRTPLFVLFKSIEKLIR